MRHLPGPIAGLLTVVLFAGCTGGDRETSGSEGSPTSIATVTVRIGCQKSSLLLNLLRASGQLQQRLGSRVRIEWREFPAGPQMLEAMNVGGVDFGHAGETPPIFAQAAGVPLVYAACEDASPASEALLVQTDSPIRAVSQLKGKRVALNKGSNVQYFLVRALEQAGLKYADIQAVYLPPADARAAFESHSVDAWAIWDPYYSAAEQAGSARLLCDGAGLVANRGFYLAARQLAADHEDLLIEIVRQLAETSAWVAEHQDESVKFLADTLRMDPTTIERAELRRRYNVSWITPDVVAYQQQVAHVSLALGLIPREINVADAVWNPAGLQEEVSHGNVLVPALAR